MGESSTSDPKYQLVAEAHEWAINKLVVGEPFRGLLLSSHPSGKKMSRYDLPTTEEALARCEAELSGELSDATAYAFVYDAFLKNGDSVTPALVFRMESRAGNSAVQFTQRYRLKKALLSRKVSYKALEEFQPLGQDVQWLK